MNIGLVAIGAALCLLSCAAAGLSMGLATGGCRCSPAGSVRQDQLHPSAGLGVDGIHRHLRLCKRVDHDVYPGRITRRSCYNGY